MEMLIVIAIIAILIAIAIPIFTGQLERAREATDEANMRSAYAECSAAVMTGVADANSNVTLNKTGDVVTSATKTVTLSHQTDGLEGGGSVKIGTVDISSDNFKKGTATVTVNADGTASITIK